MTDNISFHMNMQVTIGELGPGDCVGEVLLRGTDVQPYTIVSATAQTRIGWIDSWSIRGEGTFMPQEQLHSRRDRRAHTLCTCTLLPWS